MAYKPVPFSPELAPPDLTIGQTMWFLQLSARAVQRLVANGELDSYRLGGDARRITFASVRSFRQACIDRGSQLSQRPPTGKRPPGRPRKPRPEEGRPRVPAE